MADELALALAAERAIVRRGVRSALAIDGGWVLRHPPLEAIWHLNRIHLTQTGDLGADALEQLADAHLHGLPHRRVTLDDATTADALWPELERRGWRRERSVVMALAADAPRPTVGADPRVRPLDEPALHALHARAFADDARVTASSSALPALLADAQATLRAGTEAHGFGVAAEPGGDEPVTSATLYLDPDVDGRRVAFVDQVATLRPFRERGLATAVMHAAVAAAREWDADAIALFADADDWPQVMYANLGFVTLGRQVVVHREAD